jgi:hypothetical protein
MFGLSSSCVLDGRIGGVFKAGIEFLCFKSCD